MKAPWEIAPSKEPTTLNMKSGGNKDAREYCVIEEMDGFGQAAEQPML